MLRNLLLAIASIGLALALCEGLLRVFASRELPRASAYVLDPDTGKRLRPGWSGTEFGTEVRVNSRGLRSPETSYDKPPGTYRILALGDSWTFGFRMTEPDSYPRQLERVLNERLRARGAMTRVEVINAGVVGYSTHQEAAYLRVEGYRYGPDLVLVAFYPVNDAEDKSSKYVRYQRLREIHPWLLDVYTFPRSLYLRQFWKGARRAVKRRIAELRMSAARQLGRDDPGARAILENDWTRSFRAEEYGWQLAQEGLQSIGDTARRIDAEGLVVLLPDVLDLARYEDRYHPRVAPLIEGAARRSGLAWLDLLEGVRPHRGREPEIRLEGYRHPSASGYRLIAHLVGDTIERDYLSRPDSRPDPRADPDADPRTGSLGHP